jgi:hypothetical protein
MVLTAVTMSNTIFWDVTPHSLVEFTNVSGILLSPSLLEYNTLRNSKIVYASEKSVHFYKTIRRHIPRHDLLHSNPFSGSFKKMEFLHQLRVRQPLKNCTPWNKLISEKVYYNVLLLLLLLLWLYSPLLGLGLFLSFLILYTVGRTLWMGDQPVARPLPTHRTTQTHNKRTQYSHPCLGWDLNPRSQRSSERRQFIP